MVLFCFVYNKVSEWEIRFVDKGRIMMKLGIVTITGGDNYGQSLQNYALYSTLKKIGLDVKTLKLFDGNSSFTYYYNDMKLNNIRFPFIKSVYFYFFKQKVNEREKNFNKFNKNIRFKNFKLNRQVSDVKIFDYVICGSDQIWNTSFSFINNNLDYYFAKFVSPEKRIAYSASIGIDDISQECVEYFCEAINEYKDISVREYKAAEIIKKYTDRDVITTIDPTLLLDAEEWRKVESKVNVDGKYILTYFLGEKSKELEQYIERVSQKYDCKIINLYGENCKNVKSFNSYHYGPSEFLWLIDNCEVLFTDSFHGCCFSVIFRKSCKWFSRQEKNVENMNSRMETLFKKLELGDKFIGSLEDYDNVFEIDYSGIDKVIKKEKDYSYNYLKGALGLDEN